MIEWASADSRDEAKIHPNYGLCGKKTKALYSSWHAHHIDLVCSADDTNMKHRENLAADKRKLITDTQRDFGGVVHPGKWQHLRAMREKSRRTKAEEARAKKRRQTLAENQDKETEEIWDEIERILEPSEEDEDEPRDNNTVVWASLIEVLGSWISADGSNERDLCERLRKARKLWRAVLARLPKLSLTKKMKGNVVKGTVIASLLYGCEVMVHSAKQIQMLQGFINRKVRGIALKKSDGIEEMKGKMTMTDLRFQVGIDHVEVYIADRTLGWIGHTARRGA